MMGQLTKYGRMVPRFQILYGQNHNPWSFVTKIVLTYCEKNCFSDREKLLKSEADGREIAKILRSLEQFFRTVQVVKHNAFFNLFLEVSQLY